MSHFESNNVGIINYVGGQGGRAMGLGLAEAFPGDVTMAVNMSDSGFGGTGDLRYLFNGPAVGDARNILAAVSGNNAGPLFAKRFGEEHTVDDVKRLNDHFVGAAALQGSGGAARLSRVMESVVGVATEVSEFRPYGLRTHTYGNFVLEALRQEYGHVAPAIREASCWLEARARVIPVTNEPHNLVLYDEAKHVYVYGQAQINKYTLSDPSKAVVWLEIGHIDNFIEDDPGKVEDLLEESRYARRPQATREVVDATIEADIILAGPGSFITSVRSALLPFGVGGAFAQQQLRGGVWAAVDNIDPDRTAPTLSLHDYLGWLYDDTGRPVDYVIYDPDAGMPDRAAIPDRTKVRDATAMSASLVDARPAPPGDPNDPHRDHRATRLTNAHAVAGVIQAIYTSHRTRNVNIYGRNQADARFQSGTPSSRVVQ